MMHLYVIDIIKLNMKLYMRRTRVLLTLFSTPHVKPNILLTTFMFVLQFEKRHSFKNQQT